MIRPLAPCGTLAAYRRHHRHGEPIDAACREAARAQSANERRAAHIPARKMGPTGCGTRRGYRQHLAAGESACDPCRWANAAADRRLHTTGSTLA